jgi:hypothetical protein
MAKKYKAPEFTAMRTSSPGAKAALLRSGAGKHDPRPNRLRTRSTAKRAAIAVSW